MLPLYVAFVACLVVAFLIQRYRRMTVFQRNGIPGPKPHFIYGNVREFYAKGNSQCFQEWTKEFGPIVGWYFGAVPHLVVTDIELLKNIQVKDFKFFSNRPQVIDGGVHPTAVGQSMIFWNKGQKWKDMRSVMSPSFNASKLKQMVPNMEERINIVIKKLRQVSKEGAEEFDIYPLFQQMTFSIIAKSAFDMDINPMDNPNDPYYKAMRGTVQPHYLSLPSYLNVLFPELTFIIHPIRTLFVTILEVLHLTNEGVIFDFCRKVIAKRKDAKTGYRKDLLQLMIETRPVTSETLSTPDTKDSKLDSMMKTTSRDGNYLTENELVSNSFVFFLAGHETTSIALAFITHHLINYPEIQAQMRLEAKELLLKEGKFDYNTVTKLELMEGFVHETLRLYPLVAPFTGRVASEDYTYKGMTIPKGTGIFVGVYPLHRDPEYWPNPDVFDPHRFTGENRGKANVAGHSIYWQPFGTGPRHCLGMRFALLEIKLTLAHLLLNFKFTPGPNSQMGTDLSLESRVLVVVPDKGVKVKVNPIKKVL